MIILDGKATAETIKKELAEEVAKIKASGHKTPHLAAILVGNDGASETYVSNKVRTCKEIGFNSSLFRFPSSVTQSELLEKIKSINTDPEIDGLIVQSPLPSHISFQKITETIHPSKDVDGFNPVNAGRMLQNVPSFIAATPKGILTHCVVIGRSNIVGMPVSTLLARNTWPGNCTVTICHSKTKNIQHHTLQADILIAAIGRPGFVKIDMIKEGAVVIDVGITRVADTTSKKGYRLKGDVDFEKIAPKCSYITPVPGGVGPMTIIGLLQNTLAATRKEFTF
jgi:methylenetetrahydrofolate dehydrogenase (NADP+) / methenyltetrahydrofolate cyclohydrolase